MKKNKFFEKQIKSFYHKCFYGYLEYVHKRYLTKLKKKETIKVLFFASNLSMWHYQHLLEKLKLHQKFSVYVVISPLKEYSDMQKKTDADELRVYFAKHNTEIVDVDDKRYLDIQKCINPDIIFYTQFYYGGLISEHNPSKFCTKLLCAYPYGFPNIYADWAYNNKFQNIAWKLFYPTENDLENTQNIAWNKGRNVVITGYPNADDFLSAEINDIWKPQKTKKKRIIYAPHFTIEKGLSPLYFSNFLKFHKLMQEVAIKYRDRIQFAFKPHPRLLTELYKHSDWGKERTDEYYDWWRTQENTQLESEGYIDLFKTSDALIHDCGSFSIEYFYTKNPVMYISGDIDEIKKQKTKVGIVALETCYVGKDNNDVLNFIENVVLCGNDSLKQQRNDFFNKYLLPPNGKTVAQNTMDNILASLEIQ